MRGKVFNPQVFIEFLCYILFSLLILHLVISNKYLSYVTPRMKPYLIFTSIAMAVWACVGLRRLFNPQHRLRAAHCFVLVLPILFIIMPHKPISGSDISAGYVNRNILNNIAGNNSYKLSTLPTISPLEDNTSMKDNTGVTDKTSDMDQITSANEEGLSDRFSNGEAGGQSDAYAADEQNILPDDRPVRTLPGLDEINQRITISHEEFYLWLVEIFSNMDKFDGYQITIKGFVFKDDPELIENEFMISRLLMSCCTADLVPGGIICRYDKISELEADTWITVEGVIQIGEYLGYDEPQIIVKNISAAEEPEDPYIYPY